MVRPRASSDVAQTECLVIRYAAHTVGHAAERDKRVMASSGRAAREGVARCNVAFSTEGAAARRSPSRCSASSWPLPAASSERRHSLTRDGSVARADRPLPRPRRPPIVVGSTLSLTGSFAATGIIHKAAGEAFVRWINANGGLLGRPVEWKVLRRRVRPGQGHGALRAADQPGQGRPDHGPVRDAEHRRGAGGRRAARLRAAEPHGGAHLRAHLQVPVPDLVDGRASRTSRCRRPSSRR